jgi:hypothetical protein
MTSLSSVGGVPGGPPNRKQRREFVWSYGAPDSVGEKRERAEAFRGREIVRRDWGHDDDNGDFQRDRRSGNRRHRSLSGWARSSRCQGEWTIAIVPTTSIGTQLPFVVMARG